VSVVAAAEFTNMKRTPSYKYVMKNWQL